MSSGDRHIQHVRILALSCLFLLSGCAFLASDRPMVLSTNPPGATILIDGKSSGYVTPCQIQLDIDEDVRLDFASPGFRTETRYLTPNDEVYAILWSEMYAGPQTWRFPLWLPLKDFLVPVKWTEAHGPSRIHIDLDRLSDAPPAGPKPAAEKPPAEERDPARSGRSR